MHTDTRIRKKENNKNARSGNSGYGGQGRCCYVLSHATLRGYEMSYYWAIAKRICTNYTQPHTRVNHAIALIDGAPFAQMISNTYICCLTHWGREPQIWVRKLTMIIGSGNGLPPVRQQAIIGTNAGILLIRPWGTNFSEILIEIYIFWFKKMHLKLSSGIWWPFISASMC